VAERPAVNASPLIYLSRAGLLDFLKIAGNEIIVPVAVAEDIRRRGPTDPTVQALQKAPWLVITNTTGMNCAKFVLEVLQKDRMGWRKPEWMDSP
jgi:hypothetical protein